MRVIQETYGFSISACVLEEEGRPVAGVPWCRTSELMGTRLVTLPFCDYCDLLAGTPEEARVLVDHVRECGQPWTLRTIAQNLPGLKRSVAQSAQYKLQRIDLSADTSVLWERLAPMAQRGVRKAEHSGVEIRRATERQQLREWYLLHLRLRKTKYGLLSQPYVFFENIWDTFVAKEQGFLVLAFYEGQPIAGTLYLLWKDTCYYKFNASDPNYMSLRPNNLLLWRGMLEAKERGCRVLDLGRSNTQQEGLIAFKRAFGAIEDDLHFLTCNIDGRHPEPGAEARRLFQDLTRLFVKESVPDNITEEMGALLYRYFI